MIDIDAIRKAAEAIARDNAEVMSRYTPRSVHLDPATVLELCRLAEIGERFEEATESAKHDIEKLLGVDMRLPVDPNYNPTFDI